MRRLFLTAALLACCGAVSTAQPTASRIDIVERWLFAALQHEPGKLDAQSELAASWSVGELRTLWVDINTLILLMRNPRLTATLIEYRTEGKRKPDRIIYQPSEFRRLQAIARAAIGTLAVEGGAAGTPELRDLSLRVRAAQLRGEANSVLERGALLHADAAMRAGFQIEAPTRRTETSPGPRPMRFLLKDGQSLDMGYGALHWEIARFLLDHVAPRPESSPMVRDFYCATLAWLQQENRYEVGHLTRARELFPDDACLAFLAGAMHEAFASPQIQSVVRTTTLPYGVSFGVDPPPVEWRRAERFFRRAVQVDPRFDEARLRHGRVLGLLDRHNEAAAELEQVVDAASDMLVQYYAALFIGAEHEALGRFDAARDAYLRAAALNDHAQAPHLALSQLARRTANRNIALRELQQVFDTGSSEEGADDPWWIYAAAAGRNADDLLAALWRPFRNDPTVSP